MAAAEPVRAVLLLFEAEDEAGGGVRGMNMDKAQPTLSSGWAKLVVENRLTHEQYVTITPDDMVTSRPEIVVRLTPVYEVEETEAMEG